jgi:predicted  nucleic acid-binding Zn-ribbon protein
MGKNEVPPVNTPATGVANFTLSPDEKSLHYTLSAHDITGVMVESRYAESKKFYKEFDSTPDDAGEALIHLQSNLKHTEDEIFNLESRVSDLRALKQLIIKELHEIGRENLEGHLERQVLYKIIEDRGEIIKGKSREKGFTRKSIYELSKTLDQNESRIKDAVAKINSKLEKKSAEILLKDFC